MVERLTVVSPELKLSYSINHLLTLLSRSIEPISGKLGAESTTLLS